MPQCENYHVASDEAESTQPIRCDAEAHLPIMETVMGKEIEMHFCFECYQAVHGDGGEDN